MPGGNGTGPSGMGPMTGRVAGFCAGYSVPGFMNFAGGRAYRGAGLGFGAGGRGRRNRYATGVPGRARIGYAMPEWGSYEADGGDERQLLKQQADYLQRSIDQINKRIQEIEDRQN
jgi:hypothetical protein